MQQYIQHLLVKMALFQLFGAACNNISSTFWSRWHCSFVPPTNPSRVFPHPFSLEGVDLIVFKMQSILVLVTLSSTWKYKMSLNFANPLLIKILHTLMMTLKYLPTPSLLRSRWLFHEDVLHFLNAGPSRSLIELKSVGVSSNLWATRKWGQNRVYQWQWAC